LGTYKKFPVGSTVRYRGDAPVAKADPTWVSAPVVEFRVKVEMVLSP
jgi:hypothetical protein